MRVLFLTSDLSRVGGIQKYNNDLIRAFREYGVKIDLVELKSSDTFLKIKFSLDFFLTAFFSRPNMIFCANINFSPLGFWAKKILGLKYALIFYGIEAWDIKKPSHKKAV